MNEQQNLMVHAAHEIRILRRQNEVLTAKAEVFDFMRLLLYAQAPGQSGTPDIAGMLDKTVQEQLAAAVNPVPDPAPEPAAPEPAAPEPADPEPVPETVEIVSRDGGAAKRPADAAAPTAHEITDNMLMEAIRTHAGETDFLVGIRLKYGIDQFLKVSDADRSALYNDLIGQGTLPVETAAAVVNG